MAEQRGRDGEEMEHDARDDGMTRPDRNPVAEADASRSTSSNKTSGASDEMDTGTNEAQGSRATSATGVPSETNGSKEASDVDPTAGSGMANPADMGDQG